MPNDTTQSISTTAIDAARGMLDALASIGVYLTSLLRTDQAGGKVRYWGSLPLSYVREQVPGILAAAIRKRHNVIIRPATPPGVALIQLDDLDAAMVEALRPMAFMALETSPGNFQAWLAMPADESRCGLHPPPACRCQR